MNKLLSSIYFLATCLTCVGQNVGIGNADPAYRLDVSGRMRIRSGNDVFNSAGFWLGGIAGSGDEAFIGVVKNQLVGIYGNYGAGWAFTLNTENGRVGIGTDSATAPLSFSDGAGSKIMLGRRQGFTGEYGIGINSNQLRFYMPTSINDMHFGMGDNASFTSMLRLSDLGTLVVGNGQHDKAGLVVERKQGAVNAMFGSNTTGVAIESNFPGIGINTYFRSFRRAISTGFGGYIGVDPVVGGMNFFVTEQSVIANDPASLRNAITIRPNGHVGIGTGAAAAFPLDVNGNVRLRRQSATAAQPAVVFADETGVNRGQVGALGNGYFGIGDMVGNYQLGFNVSSGSLLLNGSEGNYGQVLASGGPDAMARWLHLGALMPSLQYGSSTVATPAQLGWFNFANTQQTYDLRTGRWRLIFSALVEATNNTNQNGAIRIGVSINGTHLSLIGTEGITKITVPASSSRTFTIANVMADVAPTNNCIVQWAAAHMIGSGSNVSSVTIHYWSVQFIPID
ncbi:MAG: hypothetical protein MUF62_05460 [Chitinophagaceae bacterium]|jgi:hypothetical protein|nr:hypothetical protein [Chitinophagaceae bacterium]